MEKFYELAMENFNIIIFLICFCIGYVIKNAKLCEKIDNTDIPLIIVILGIILGIVQCILNNQPFNLNCVAMGAFSALLSTSVYEVYKSLVIKFNKDYGNINPNKDEVID